MKNITVVIVTYHTPKDIILDCLNSIDKDIKVLIVENSEKFSDENLIKSKFNNVKILCSGSNLGYGAGNNFGIKQVETDYVLILNPDTICDKNFFSQISNVISDVNDFSIIGCQYLDDDVFMPAGFFDIKKNKEFTKNFRENRIGYITKVDWVTGQSMLINLKKFKNKEIFDEKFFLYFEEFDLCKSLSLKGENVFSTNKLKIKHLGFKSSFDDNSIQRKSLNRMREWHWMWSTFYFYKKNFSYLYAVHKVIGKFIKALLKIIFYSITFNNLQKEKYKYRFLGIFNAILGRPSNFRDDLK